MAQYLTTLDRVKVALGIPATDLSQNEPLGLYVSAATAAICKWCKRELLFQPCRVEYPRGSAQPFLALRQRPVSAFVYTGTLTQGSAVVTGLSSTANLAVGMPVTIGAAWTQNSPLLTGSTILSIDSTESTVTLTNPYAAPVISSAASTTIGFGVSVCFDPQGNFGFGAGSGTYGPFTQGTEYRLGLDYAPKIDGGTGTQGQGHSGMLVRLRGFSSLGFGSWGDYGGWGNTGYRSTLTAGRAPGWSDGTFGQLQVRYSSGYPVIPNDLQQCATAFAVLLYNTTQTGLRPYNSENYEGYGYALLASGKTPELASLRQLLTAYRELATAG